MTDILDNLLTPQQIAERIKASAGVTLATRTIWEKARRIGVAKKIGRSMLIHVDDIPKLLEPESKPNLWPRSGEPAVYLPSGPRSSTNRALALLKKNRKQKKND
ncbi:hypothetical protein [Neorhizobium galegae]|uniref:hypothetical protein n=1 Tax=Neorhizobium galegae TaxID=399 RepID=UPI0012735690|nr:hypothetical protein [Neorhizobium galegae]KAA9386923.1 hypothetical protein F4V88_10800 [Neorhizobium galegae]MCM2499901.1 hypothetical protein [Neorhizobium galegae]